ncbi:MAG: hypothetical protein Q7T36_11780 [Fluviicoccus sp.]|uniref:hypothetical protein n=1 Tax=Fluviicoccus sp. TaxID=2003552 RepID=UPI0027177F1E|nr:hypothetical protein [Fluviicoccus sp.]MDO8331139.1 hypothetical protein [Fluviicoccus sp.]
MGNKMPAATNPNGISRNYLTNFSIPEQTAPMMSRIDIMGTRVKTQAWNMVFMPYSTGDVHTGNIIVPYDKSGATTRVQYHKGVINAQVVAALLSDSITDPAALKESMARQEEILKNAVVIDSARQEAEQAAMSAYKEKEKIIMARWQGLAPGQHQQEDLEKQIQEAREASFPHQDNR